MSAADAVRIRSLTRDDEGTLWVALYHAVHVLPGAPPPAPDVVRQPALARYVAGWGRAGDAGVAAEIGGDVVGAAWLRRAAPDAAGYGFIDTETPELSIAVWPGHRGRGVGTELLRRLFQDCAAPSISLSVSQRNPARRLYKRLGFHAVGPPSGGSVTMVRRGSPRPPPPQPGGRA